MERILFLGGSYQQIPAIKEARALGLYVITCDYLPNNPGHKYADEYHNVSTTDATAVLDLAQRIKPDIVMSYASDPGAAIAAYVAEQLGLPGNPYASVKLLSKKDLFRAFQRDHGFNSPRAIGLNENEVHPDRLKGFNYPLIVKPVDSSGSKGVSKISEPSELALAASYALSFSRMKRVIVEEFIVCDGPQLTGDGLVLNGELVFSCFADQLYDTSASARVPCGALWPTLRTITSIRKVEQEAAKVIRATGLISGSVNIEVRITPDNEVYILEIGPRSGGNYMPQAIKYASTFDMVRASLDVLLGKTIQVPITELVCTAYYALHSDRCGTLVSLKLTNELKSHVREFHQYVFPGEKVLPFHNSSATLGILILTFRNHEEMNVIMSHIANMIEIVITSLTEPQ